MDFVLIIFQDKDQHTPDFWLLIYIYIYSYVLHSTQTTLPVVVNIPGLSNSLTGCTRTQCKIGNFLFMYLCSLKDLRYSQTYNPHLVWENLHLVR